MTQNLRCDADAAEVPAWFVSFNALVESRLSTPFAWGTNDCCMWAADAVLAQTGVDLAADLRGTYSTAFEAMSLLESRGGLQGVAALAGAPIPALMAQAGDIGLVRHEDRDLLAVCVGPAWLAPAADGMAVLPMAEATQAWRVQRG